MEYDLLIQKILRGNGYSPDAARMIAAVARHESANYTSPLFRNHKNFFGMRPAKKRRHAQDYETPHKNPQQRYAGFNRAADSVRDMVLYLDYSNYPFHYGSARDLVTLMKKKGYFEADFSEYLGGVEAALPKVAVL